MSHDLNLPKQANRTPGKKLQPSPMESVTTFLHQKGLFKSIEGNQPHDLVPNWRELLKDATWIRAVSKQQMQQDVKQDVLQKAAQRTGLDLEEEKDDNNKKNKKSSKKGVALLACDFEVFELPQQAERGHSRAPKVCQLLNFGHTAFSVCLQNLEPRCAQASIIVTLTNENLCLLQIYVCPCCLRNDKWFAAPTGDSHVVLAHMTKCVDVVNVVCAKCLDSHVSL